MGIKTLSDVRTTSLITEERFLSTRVYSYHVYSFSFVVFRPVLHFHYGLNGLREEDEVSNPPICVLYCFVHTHVPTYFCLFLVPCGRLSVGFSMHVNHSFS